MSGYFIRFCLGGGGVNFLGGGGGGGGGSTLVMPNLQLKKIPLCM